MVTVYCVYIYINKQHTQNCYTGDYRTSSIKSLQPHIYVTKEVTMLQMNGVSALDCQSVRISAERQAGNSMHECKCMDTTRST